MPRVHHVKKARKDNPVVKAGEPYYWWKFRFGPKRYSTKRPRPSQLTQAKYGAVLDVEEGIGDVIAEGATIAELQDVLYEAGQVVRDVGEEYQESAEAQQEYFPDSETAQENEERADHYEEMADAIDEVAASLEDVDDFEDAVALAEDIEWEIL